MNRRSRRTWLRLALAGGLTIGGLAIGSVPAIAEPAGPETALTGQTSQGFPSYFRISSNGKTIDIGHIALQLTCVSGAEMALPNFVSHLRIGPSGRVHIAANFPPAALSGGGTYTETDSFLAHVNRKRTRIIGVWRVRLAYAFPDGTTDRCDSGPVRFSDVH